MMFDVCIIDMNIFLTYRKHTIKLMPVCMSVNFKTCMVYAYSNIRRETKCYNESSSRFPKSAIKDGRLLIAGMVAKGV